MTTATESIAAKAQRYADLKAALDSGYSELKALEYEIIGDLRATYPQEWADWERGARSFQAEGVSVEVKRTYDLNKLWVEFAEELPELFEKVTPEPYLKADGRKLAQMWKQADLARRLEKCVVPQTPKIQVGK